MAEQDTIAAAGPSVEATETVIVPATTSTDDAAGQAGPSQPRPYKRKQPPTAEELESSLHRRVTVIQEGDNVLLRLPSDGVKAVVASRDGLVQLGKYGSFPSSELLGLHYDITYEVTKRPEGQETASEAEKDAAGIKKVFGQTMGKKSKKKAGKRDDKDSDKFRTNPGWQCCLRPLKRRPLVEAVIDDIQETNEFIDDDDSKLDLLSQDEIAELKKQGLSANEIMERQIARHDKFALKTDFSKEKWRKRKEKKFSQTVHPLAPTTANITTHYLARSPQTIMYLREDSISQLLNLANIRPGGRYLVIDDTGGLVTAAILDRMGCQGRVLSFTDNDSPPSWGVLQVMNFSEEELSCVKWLTWLEAEEDYVKPPPPDEDGMPAVSASKQLARQRKHNAQVSELNRVRDELHLGGWDGLVLATELNPISVLSRLTPYVLGSGTITVFSPYFQILAETLAWMKKDPNYLSQTLSESWMRTYQVLPGRTHPLMTTSATGGYILHATRVYPATFKAESHQRHNNRNRNQKPKAAVDSAEAGPAPAAQPENGGAAEPMETDIVESVEIS